MRAAANSPAKGILRLLAFYAGHHLTADQIARSVLVPPGRVEELLSHLHARGHVEQHSAGGATTYSARPDALEHYLNRLANLQLMDAHKNNVKDANFSGTTRRALEERERLLAGCDISTEVGFKKHLDALRVHVITVSEIGAKGGEFHGEEYF